MGDDRKGDEQRQEQGEVKEGEPGEGRTPLGMRGPLDHVGTGGGNKEAGRRQEREDERGRGNAREDTKTSKKSLRNAKEAGAMRGCGVPPSFRGGQGGENPTRCSLPRRVLGS
jgi:hypothetical protein